MIPATIQDVTPAWLGERLGAPVRHISPVQIGQGIGLMGDIFTVAIDYEGEASDLPASVVVKLPSSFEDNRQQGIALGMFDAEVKFYSELAPEATVGLPDIYFADIVPGSADFVIVMEDLSRLSMVNQYEGMSVDQAFAAVRVLASIHAVWWDKVDTSAFEWIPDMVGARIEFIDQMLVDILPVFEQGFAGDLSQEELSLYREFAGKYLKVNQQIAGRSPWTLVHQDYRVENLMFGDPLKDEVVVIDWQGIGRGPGVYDLAYILGGSMDTQLRRANESDLVRAYHERLLEAGINDYSFDEAWRDYGFAHLQGGLATSMFTGGSIDLSNERGRELVATMSRRHAAAALDHDGLTTLKSL